MSNLRALSQDVPIYVTRENADGQIAEYTLSIWMTLLAIFVVWANLIAWGFYGLYAVVAQVF